MHVSAKFARGLHLLLIFSFIFGFFAILQAPSTQAQARVSDKDMEALIRNLRNDAKSFRPQFESAVHKSTIRNTSQEKETNDLAKIFAKQTDDLLNRFKKDRRGESEFNSAMASAEQIDNSVHSLALEPDVKRHWKKIRTELHQIANAYGVPDHFQDQAMGTMPESDSTSCLQSAGKAKANQLVDECMQVSPATHPPCNAQNSCGLIISEIKRSCGLLAKDAPGFCKEYQ
jgi:hypothetical protein